MGENEIDDVGEGDDVELSPIEPDDSPEPKRNTTNPFMDDFEDDEDSEEEPEVEEVDDEEEIDDPFETPEEDEDSKEEERLTSEKDKKVEEKPKKELSRYEKRIQQLIHKEKDLKTQHAQQIEQFQSQLSQFQSWAQNVQQYQAQLEKDLAVRNRELELIQAQRGVQEEETLSPVERLKRDTIREAKELAKQELLPEIEELRAQNKQFIAAQETERKQSAQKQRIQGYKDSISMAVKTMLGGVKPEKAQLLNDDLEIYTLNIAAARNIPPDQAAKEFHKLAHRYVSARSEIKSKKNLTKIQNGKKIPQPIPGAKKTARGKPKVTHADAVKAGYSDALDYMSRNS